MFFFDGCQIILGRENQTIKNRAKPQNQWVWLKNHTFLGKLKQSSNYSKHARSNNKDNTKSCYSPCPDFKNQANCVALEPWRGEKIWQFFSDNFVEKELHMRRKMMITQNFKANTSTKWTKLKKREIWVWRLLICHSVGGVVVTCKNVYIVGKTHCKDVWNKLY